jgi:mannose-1-phosphate guanylyltransferase
VALYPVIMAGGSGTRFWPLSRKACPKQFLPLTGERALIAETVHRLRPLATLKETFVVCGKAHAASVKKLLKGLPAKNLLVEPMARNTAPCVGLAAAVVARKDPTGILLVLPSDAHVSDAGSFRKALEAAASAAAGGHLVTLGIRPRHPETGFGYIQRGEPFAEVGGHGIHRVRRFVEKPNLETAKGYLASGDYLWNAGIFVLRADRVLEELFRHLPESRGPLEEIGRSVGKATFARVLKKAFARMPAISFDYAVMEKASDIAVVPADFGWSDLGSFSALPEVRRLDALHNATEGETVLVDVENSVVLGGKRPIAVIGVKDMVVVDAGDAILVCPRDRAQDVRRVVDELSRRRLDRYL